MKNFNCVVALERVLLIDFEPILDKDLQYQTRRNLPLTPKQSLITFKLYDTGAVFVACKVMHKVSTAIVHVKQKGNFRSFPENLADIK